MPFLLDIKIQRCQAILIRCRATDFPSGNKETAAEKNQFQHSLEWESKVICSQSGGWHSLFCMFSCQLDKEIFAHLFHPVFVPISWLWKTKEFLPFQSRLFIISSLRKLVVLVPRSKWWSCSRSTWMLNSHVSWISFYFLSSLLVYS